MRRPLILNFWWKQTYYVWVWPTRSVICSVWAPWWGSNPARERSGARFLTEGHCAIGAMLFGFHSFDLICFLHHVTKQSTSSFFLFTIWLFILLFRLGGREGSDVDVGLFGRECYHFFFFSGFPIYLLYVWSFFYQLLYENHTKKYTKDLRSEVVW